MISPQQNPNITVNLNEKLMILRSVHKKNDLTFKSYRVALILELKGHVNYYLPIKMPMCSLN